MKIAKIAALLLTVALGACSAVPIQPTVQSPDLASYDTIAIEDVKVYSLEPAAADNQELQEKLMAWETYSRQQLTTQVESSNIKLVSGGQPANGLLLNLDVNVRYGNRALRWSVGFGAGKGGVYPTLTAKDASTGEVKYEAQINADLIGGPAGGDVGALLEVQVQRLIEHFVAGISKPRVAQSGQ